MSVTNSRVKLSSIGGGKGGIGKSIVTLGLGIALARQGKKVILIDADLGGANLHTLMGIRYPHVTMGHFLSRQVARLKRHRDRDRLRGDRHHLRGRRSSGGRQPHLGAKNAAIEPGAGTAGPICPVGFGSRHRLQPSGFLQLFSWEDCPVHLQSTSLQIPYGFIKSALYRKLARDFAKDEEIINLLYESGNAPEGSARSLRQILAHFQTSDPEKYALLSQALADYQLFLIVNLVRSNADLRSPEIIRSVCEEFLNVHPEILGQVAYDAAWRRG